MSSHGNHAVSSRRTPVLLLGLAFALALMTACGKKGPLYLPDEAAAPDKGGAQVIGTTPPAKK